MGVVVDLVGKGDHGAAAIGFNIAAKGCDLERNAVFDQGDGAVVDAGGHRLDAGITGQVHHPLGPGIGADIQIRDRRAQQRIAHTAADKQRLVAPRRQHAADPARGRIGQPAVGDAGHPASRSLSPRRMRAVAPQM